MADNKLKVEVELVITDGEIDDLMVCALEGGINYWCNEVRPSGVGIEFMKDNPDLYMSDLISRNHVLFLYDIEQDITETLTKEKLLNGIKLAFNKGLLPLEYGDNFKLDMCSVDAIVADNIIQLALFNDIVYC